MKTISLRNGDFAVRDIGRGRPLLFVHGFPLSGNMWDEQAETLASDFRAIVPDLRGFGRSRSAVGECVTMENYADDLAELLTALRITEPIVFCGLSMGGYIGWQFWRKHRDRVAALIACDTRAVADTPKGAITRRQMADRVMVEGPGFVAEAMLPKLLAPETLRHAPQVVEKVRAMIASNSPAAIAAAQRGMAVRPNATELLTTVDVPALVVVGEHDAIATVDEMRGIAEGMPRAEFAIIPGTGHMPPMEAPAEFNQLLGAFLRRLS